MSEFAAPLVAPDPAVAGEEHLSPEALDALLAEFRAWLLQAPAASEEPGDEGAPGEAPLSLHALVAQFTALRHEINLNTKASRAQQEHNVQTLQELSKTTEDLRDRELRDRDQTQDDLLRPLLKALVETYDALALAHREVQRMLENLEPMLEEFAAPGEPPAGLPDLEAALVQAVPLPWWARLLGLDRKAGKLLAAHLDRQHAELASAQQDILDQQERAADTAERLRQLLHGVLVGYAMSRQRLERTLDGHGLEAIPTVGHPFDPEQMEVIDVVHDSDRPANEVIEEVRRGYLWNGRVFRFALVRVARSERREPGARARDAVWRRVHLAGASRSEPVESLGDSQDFTPNMEELP